METAELVAYLHQLAEDDKRRLAYRLHDELGAPLTVAKFEVHWLMQLELAKAAPAQHHLHRLSEVLDEVLIAHRQAVEGLRPALIDQLGLSAALEGYVSSKCQRAALSADCEQLAGADAVPREQAIIIYRLVEEGLANIIDRARSKRVEISLVRDERGFRLRLSEDADSDASELPPIHRHRVASMRHRARALGGSLDIETSAGQGTHVSVFFPAKG